MAVYKTLKVPKEVLQKSLVIYFNDAEMRKKYEEGRNALVEPREPRELSKDETMAAVHSIERSRIAMSGLALSLLGKRQNMRMVYEVCKLGALKTADVLYNETGVEIQDLKFNLKRLNLEEDEDYKKVIEEYKQKREAGFEGV